MTSCASRTGTRTAKTNILNGDPKVKLNEKDLGYSIGGPIGKPGGSNKLFFFYAHEYSPRTAGGDVVRFRFPTLLERAGDFSQSTDNNGVAFPFIKDPRLSRHVLRDQHRRLLPVGRRDRTHPGRSPVWTRSQYPEDVPGAERQRARRRLQLRDHPAGGEPPREPAGRPSRLPAVPAVARDLQVLRMVAAGRADSGDHPGVQRHAPVQPVRAHARGDGELLAQFVHLPRGHIRPRPELADRVRAGAGQHRPDLLPQRVPGQ